MTQTLTYRMQKPIGRGVHLNLAHPLAANCIHCSILNEGTGMFVRDLSPFRSHGIRHPSSTTQPQWNQGTPPVASGRFMPRVWMRFSGTDQQGIGFGARSYMQSHDRISAFVWCRWNGTAAASVGHVYGKGDAGEAWVIGNANSSGTNFTPQYRLNGTTRTITSAGFGQLTGPTPWMLLAMTWSAASQTIRCYRGIYGTDPKIVKGTDVTNTNATIFPQGGRLMIGTRDATARWWSGEVSHCMWFKREWTQAEVEWLYRHPFSLFRRNRIPGVLEGLPSATPITLAAGIATAEALETDSKLVLFLGNAGGIATAEALEADAKAVLNLGDAGGIGTGESLESDASLALSLGDAGGIASGETFETDASLVLSLAVTEEIASGEAFETDAVITEVPQFSIDNPDSIPTGEVMGQPVITTPPGIELGIGVTEEIVSGEVLEEDHTVVVEGQINPSGIPSRDLPVSVGTSLSLILGVSEGIASGEAFEDDAVIGGVPQLSITVTEGIASGEAFETDAVVSIGAVSLTITITTGISALSIVSANPVVRQYQNLSNQTDVRWTTDAAATTPEDLDMVVAVAWTTDSIATSTVELATFIPVVWSTAAEAQALVDLDTLIDVVWVTGALGEGVQIRPPIQADICFYDVKVHPVMDIDLLVYRCQ